MLVTDWLDLFFPLCCATSSVEVQILLLFFFQFISVLFWRSSPGVSCLPLSASCIRSVPSTVTVWCTLTVLLTTNTSSMFSIECVTVAVSHSQGCSLYGTRRTTRSAKAASYVHQEPSAVKWDGLAYGRRPAASFTVPASTDGSSAGGGSSSGEKAGPQCILGIHWTARWEVKAAFVGRIWRTLRIRGSPFVPNVT